MKNLDLINELKQEGVSIKEIEELTPVVNNLNKFSELKLTGNKKNEFLNNLYKKPKRFFPFWRIFLIPSLAFAALLLFVSAPLVLAQKSLPGEALYPLKRASENVITAMIPGEKENIVIKRSEEVKKLVEEKKEQKVIKEAIKEYKKEANEARKENRKNEKIEKTLEHLKEAREKMEEENKNEIEEAIKELEENKKEIEEELEDKFEEAQERIKGKMDFKEKIRIKIEDD